MDTRILLIIEADAHRAREWQSFFAARAWSCVACSSLTEAHNQLHQLAQDAVTVMTNAKMPEGNPLLFLSEANTWHASLEWVIWADDISEEIVERAYKAGAHHVLFGPQSQPAHAHWACQSASRLAWTRRRLADTHAQETQRYQPARYLGRSKSANLLRSQLVQLGKTPLTAALIHGEQGAELGLVAKILHYSGTHHQGPYLEVNCAALMSSSAEHELFGYTPSHTDYADARKRGWIDQAAHGTLLLNNIESLPPSLQTKLLRVIEERTQNLGTQIICTSTADLEHLTLNGGFHRTLLQRLNVFRIELPPLRTRKEDLMDWVPALVNEFNAQTGKRIRFVPEQTWRILREYHWPFNFQELRNIVERAVMLANQDTLEIAPLKSQEALDLEAARLAEAAAARAEAQRQNPVLPTIRPQREDQKVVLPIDGSMDLDDMDKYIIQTVLERHNFNVMATSRALGTTRETMRYRISKYGLHKRTRNRRKATEDVTEE
jgi:two-component system, NtrC family, response regulator AtoC